MDHPLDLPDGDEATIQTITTRLQNRLQAIEQASAEDQTDENDAVPSPAPALKYSSPEIG